MSIFRKKRKIEPSAESLAARAAAEASSKQAEQDLARIERKVEESTPIIERLRARNEANHYDEWIEHLLGDLRNG
jgi:phosphoglycerate-specific signal transduction histidine kinase